MNIFPRAAAAARSYDRSQHVQGWRNGVHLKCFTIPHSSAVVSVCTRSEHLKYLRKKRRVKNSEVQERFDPKFFSTAMSNAFSFTILFHLMCNKCGIRGLLLIVFGIPLHFYLWMLVLQKCDSLGQHLMLKWVSQL